jgi:hypothetical protein
MKHWILACVLVVGCSKKKVTAEGVEVIAWDVSASKDESLSKATVTARGNVTTTRVKEGRETRNWQGTKELDAARPELDLRIELGELAVGNERVRGPVRITATVIDAADLELHSSGCTPTRYDDDLVVGCGLTKTLWQSDGSRSTTGFMFGICADGRIIDTMDRCDMKDGGKR